MPAKEYRIIPERMLSIDHDASARGQKPRAFVSAVTSIRTHPPGSFGKPVPIRTDLGLTAVEIRTAAGGTRWYGFKRAWIGADLRMHVGPINTRDEVVRGWEQSEPPYAHQ